MQGWAYFSAPVLSLPISSHACVPQKSASEKAANGTATRRWTSGDRTRRFDQPIAGCDRSSSVWLRDRIGKSGLSQLTDNYRIHFTVQRGVTKRRRRVDPIILDLAFSSNLLFTPSRAAALSRQLPSRLSSFHEEVFLSVLVFADLIAIARYSIREYHEPRHARRRGCT
jgi:hypothetical protein